MQVTRNAKIKSLQTMRNTSKEKSSPTTATSSGQDIQAHVAQSDGDITAPIRPRCEANVGPTKAVQPSSRPIRRPRTPPPRPVRHRRVPTATQRSDCGTRTRVRLSTPGSNLRGGPWSKSAKKTSAKLPLADWKATGVGWSRGFRDVGCRPRALLCSHPYGTGGADCGTLHEPRGFQPLVFGNRGGAPWAVPLTCTARCSSGDVLRPG